MPPEAYFEYYKISRDRSLSNIVDIGVGRGATSISFALGIRDSGRLDNKVYAVDQFFQRSRGPFQYSLKTNPDDCIDLNVAEYHKNLRLYGVNDLVETLVGDAVESSLNLPKDFRCDVLTIDAAGHIDQMFSRYYDFVDPGGIIILDDCKNILISRVRERIERVRGKSTHEIHTRINGMDNNARRLLLGKHKLTYYLASYFEKIGALKMESSIGKTTKIFRKIYKGKYSSLDLSGIERIDDGIVDEYVSLCVGGSG